MSNADVALTLDDAVSEVLSLLTGLDVNYDPEFDRYRTIARTLNRALAIGNRTARNTPCTTLGTPSRAMLHDDLRHLAGTLAASTGAGTKELMYRLGHASQQAALRYQHATQERDRAVADALDRLIDRTMDRNVDE